MAQLTQDNAGVGCGPRSNHGEWSSGLHDDGRASHATALRLRTAHMYLPQPCCYAHYLTPPLRVSLCEGSCAI